MANQPTSDNSSGKFATSVSFFDFAGLMKQNSKLSITLQALGEEWTGFVGARLHEDAQLLQTLRECRELPSMQRAYVQFWEKALSQYSEETQRLMRITQGAVYDAVHTDQEHIEATNGNAEAANGNAQRNEASSSSTPPSPSKKVGPSHRDRA
jgi:hypothetical protein